MTPSKDPETIRGMFSEIAGGYDKANSVLSLGIHHLWKDKLVRESSVKPGMQILDCATGTGDVAIRFKDAVGPSGRVVGIDFCQEMLDLGPAKAREAGLEVEFQVADVKKLPFASESFDIVSISFGIRNVDGPQAGLAEMIRVLKPGGTLRVLEFGQPGNRVWRSVYDFYSQKILPRMGGIITGRPKAYQYLQGSSAVFPCGLDFTDWMLQAGCAHTQFESLNGGIAYLYTGIKG
jgi:demethylmenaquinone methyltransferase/2-methoxy-6-polyprenyl-1,4-benzoquinol methylase